MDLNDNFEVRSSSVSLRSEGIPNNLTQEQVNKEVKLNQANSSDTEAPFLDLHLTISDCFVFSKMYDKRDDFNFDTVNFQFLDGDIPRGTSKM